MSSLDVETKEARMMTNFIRVPTSVLSRVYFFTHCHCEERSDEAISLEAVRSPGSSA